uniref:Histidine--tRNA ligase, chloroplastic n=1 Tax=Polysiphonia scopulorum TaxID=257860 RepID=A0A1Z1MIA3_9FLOR|nr:Histidine-tRNA ligase [Polysiphonia scopulorum]ARW65686.1 Histidine-tRNA ligase [Polysiphonia scopulorum]
MQPLRGTKDILPNESKIWQHIRTEATDILEQNNYQEIQTPIIENTELFKRSIGNFTDIVNKEMYSFFDQSNRNITLRPEGTAGIARAVISNKLYLDKNINRLWYMGPMFRYERPQKGRQRQFHQIGIECIGSNSPICDTEVIKIANELLTKFGFKNNYTLELNCIGNLQERENYKLSLTEYLKKYQQDLDKDSQDRIYTNPLRILDSKNNKTQEIIQYGPILIDYLNQESINHFNEVCKNLNYLNIDFKINNYLVRGLDYYNYTAFEIKTNEKNNQNTVCGGGRYDNLIQQLGGPYVPSVGCGIGLERLIILKQQNSVLNNISTNPIIYIAIRHSINQDISLIWQITNTLKEYKVKFELDLSNSNLSKQIKKANKIQTKICFILGDNEINNDYITVKWLTTNTQQQIYLHELSNYIKYIKKLIVT